MDNRVIPAFMAAERIIRELKMNGLQVSDPERIKDIDLCLPDGIYCDYGASRVVIWDEERDYVLKIARSRECEEYNEHEASVYQAAVEVGLEESFGWFACYREPLEEDGKYIPGIYVMEFLEGDHECVCERAFSYGFDKYCSLHQIDNPTPVTISNYYAVTDHKEEVKTLIKATIPEEKHLLFDDFIITHHVNDLHSGNVLFRNDTVVICDYAGWDW